MPLQRLQQARELPELRDQAVKVEVVAVPVEPHQVTVAQAVLAAQLAAVEVEAARLQIAAILGQVALVETDIVVFILGRMIK